MAEIPALGHLTSQDILKRSACEEIDFEGKTILDFGCGFSDLLSRIQEKFPSAICIGVDAIFSSPETIEQAKAYTKSYVENLICSGMVTTEGTLLLQKKLIQLGHFSTNNGALHYKNLDMSRENDIDYCFCSFVFTHIPESERNDIFQTLIQKMKKHGKIYIIDNPNSLKHTLNALHGLSIRETHRERSVVCIEVEIS